MRYLLTMIAACVSALFSLSGAHADPIVRLLPEHVRSCDTPCERLAVIFVHGLTGSRATWSNGNSFWPDLLATDPEIGKDIDVYRIDYDSFRFSGPAINKVVD